MEKLDTDILEELEDIEESEEITKIDPNKEHLKNFLKEVDDDFQNLFIKLRQLEDTLINKYGPFQEKSVVRGSVDKMLRLNKYMLEIVNKNDKIIKSIDFNDIDLCHKLYYATGLIIRTYKKKNFIAFFRNNEERENWYDAINHNLQVFDLCHQSYYKRLYKNI